MPKRSGSRSSRSERRAERDRAERAREHGLPEARPASHGSQAAISPPASGAEPSRASSDVGPVPLRRSAIPAWVKLLGGAAVILLGVYLLGRQRDAALSAPGAAPSAVPGPVTPTPSQ